MNHLLVTFLAITILVSATISRINYEFSITEPIQDKLPCYDKENNMSPIDLELCYDKYGALYGESYDDWE